MEELISHLKIHWFGNSYARMVGAVIIVVGTVLLRMIFVRLFNRFIKRNTDEVHNDPTNYTFLKHAVSALIYAVGIGAAIYTVPALRALANSMLAGAGILAIAIGFASQQVFSNIVSGIFIIIFKPFRVNDRIQIRETITGMVEDITLRHTVIRNFENRRVIIPNSIISQETITNADLVDGKTCKILDLSVAYGTDVAKARGIVQEVAIRNPLCIDNRNDEQIANGDPQVFVRVTAWQNSALNLRVWAWANDAPSAFRLGCELMEEIHTAFNEQGIEIPFPYQNVILKNQLE